MKAVFLAASLFLSAAASAETRPDWLSGEPKDYPKSGYIVGIGESATQDKAADKARAEIAKAFSLSLSADAKSSARETSDGKNSTYSEGVSEDVRSYTFKVLDGIEIAKYWRAEDGTNYALAVLNRPHSLQIFKEKLDDYDRDFKSLSDDLAKADGKFARLKTSLKMVEIAKARKKINGDYRVLSPDGKGVPAPENLNDALATARKAISALTVRVQATGESPESVAEQLIDRLSNYGLKVVEKAGDAPADLVIEAKVDADMLPPENLLWFWAQAKLSAKLTYGATGEIFSRFEENAQHASRAPETSVAEVIDVLTDQSARRIYQVLTSGALSDD